MKRQKPISDGKTDQSVFSRFASSVTAFASPSQASLSLSLTAPTASSPRPSRQMHQACSTLAYADSPGPSKINKALTTSFYGEEELEILHEQYSHAGQAHA